MSNCIFLPHKAADLMANLPLSVNYPFDVPDHLLFCSVIVSDTSLLPFVIGLIFLLPVLAVLYLHVGSYQFFDVVSFFSRSVVEHPMMLVAQRNDIRLNSTP
jgi:hypothetical protein